jgi:hypothetical protein
MSRRDAWYDPSIARRPWHASERRVVLRGFWGRFFIAIEPLTIALCFTVLAVGLVVRRQEGAFVIAPIFAGAAILFMIYALVLMIAVTRAVIETFGPIWVVDGYVRYRLHQARNRDPAYFAAVLDHERNVLGEWPLDTRPDALDRVEPWPALVEFTRYGGILRIDGRSTGALPDDIPALGIGAPAAFAARIATQDPPAPPDDEAAS